MFTKIHEDGALTYDGGVYRQADVYAGPDGALFVNAKGGFVRVRADGGTSHPSVKVVTLMREAPLYQDQWQRLYVAPGHDRREVLPASHDYAFKALPKG